MMCVCFSSLVSIFIQNFNFQSNSTTNWLEGLPYVQWETNSIADPETKKTPFFSMFHSTPVLGLHSFDLPDDVIVNVEREEDLEEFLRPTVTTNPVAESVEEGGPDNAKKLKVDQPTGSTQPVIKEEPAEPPDAFRDHRLQRHIAEDSEQTASSDVTTSTSLATSSVHRDRKTKSDNTTTTTETESDQYSINVGLLSTGPPRSQEVSSDSPSSSSSDNESDQYSYGDAENLIIPEALQRRTKLTAARRELPTHGGESVVTPELAELRNQMSAGTRDYLPPSSLTSSLPGSASARKTAMDIIRTKWGSMLSEKKATNPAARTGEPSTGGKQQSPETSSPD